MGRLKLGSFMLGNPAERLTTGNGKIQYRVGHCGTQVTPSCEFIKVAFKSLDSWIKMQVYIPDEGSATCM